MGTFRPSRHQMPAGGSWTVPGGAGCPPASGFAHDALLHDSADELVAAVVPFVRDGLDGGDAAVLAVQPRTAPVLRDALDGDPRVLVLDREDVYGHRAPATISSYRRLARDVGPRDGHRVRVVGEIDFGPTERDWLEWERYEAVINQALSGSALWGLCLYDTQRSPEPVLEAARRTHPQLVTPTSRTTNPAYTDPAAFLRALPVPDEPLERTPPAFAVTDVRNFIDLRHAVGSTLGAVPAPAELVEDFLLAVDEMTSNAVRHGRPPVDLRLWTAPDRIVCTITDGGPGWDDPFAGYGPAHGEDLSRGGMGLWLARQLCDHVDITGGEHHPGTGTISVRLTSTLP